MGDSIELLTQLEDDSVDAVITDPPYSSGGRTANERAQTPSNKYEQSSNKFVHRPDFPGDTMDSRSWVKSPIFTHLLCQTLRFVNGMYLCVLYH